MKANLVRSQHALRDTERFGVDTVNKLLKLLCFQDKNKSLAATRY